jgi:hypothetical protein
LKDSTWEKSWYALRDRDVSEEVNVSGDLSRDELVQRTKQAIQKYVDEEEQATAAAAAATSEAGNTEPVIVE